MCFQVVKGLGDAMKGMQGNLPVLQALRNPALRERHWTKLAAIMATPLVTNPPLTLAQLLDLKVSQKSCFCVGNYSSSRQSALSLWRIVISLVPQDKHCGCG